ncbi:MAG: hypothetical protein QF357_08775 [Dehalococcoidia bacterium]|nr:hypothetical protein [Dehalococcoidia bacterium]
MGTLIVGAIVVNVVHWDEGVHFYRPSVIITDLSLSLLLTVLIGALGVLISLRTQTVQEASQLLMGRS